MKALKRLLKILLIGVIVLIVAVGAFCGYMYYIMKKSMLDYSCADYNSDIATIMPVENAPQSKQIGVMGALLTYISTREDLDHMKMVLSDRVRLNGYNNELMSICDAYPTLKTMKIAPDFKGKTVPPEIKMHMTNLLGGITVINHPIAYGFISYLADANAAKFATEQK